MLLSSDVIAAEFGKVVDLIVGRPLVGASWLSISHAGGSFGSTCLSDWRQCGYATTACGGCRPGRPKLDVIRMLLVAGAISILLLALGWGGSVYAWGSLDEIPQAAKPQNLGARDPLLPPRVFRSASYVANLIVSTFAATFTFSCVFTIPLYFQLGRGVTAAESGVYVVPVHAGERGG